MVCTEYNNPLVLQHKEMNKLEKGQVRIKTHFAGINYAGILRNLCIII